MGLDRRCHNSVAGTIGPVDSNREDTLDRGSRSCDLAGAGRLESLRIGPGLAEDPDSILAALKKIRSLRSLHVNSVRFGNEPELQKRVRDALPGIDVRHVQ